MKTVKYFLFLAVAWIACAAQAQPLQRVVTPAKEWHSTDWYRTQAGLWENETQKKPRNEAAWENYYRATRYLGMYTQDEAERKKLETAKAEIFKKMERAIPRTFTLYLMTYYHHHNDAKYAPDMQKAYDMRPDDVSHFSDYLAFFLCTNQVEEAEKLCKKWYDSGEYSPDMLNYAYNELAGTDERALVFTDGDSMIFSKLILQHGKNLFRDRTVISISLLWIDSYRKSVTDMLGIEPFVIDASIWAKYKDWAEVQKAMLKYLMESAKCPVYFSFGIGNSILEGFEENLYSEGLVMRYAPKSYDNLAVKRRNYEQVYLTDYLRDSFYKDKYESAAQLINLGYVTGFQSLLSFYKESGDINRYNRLYRTLKEVIDRAPSYQSYYLNLIGENEAKTLFPR